MNLKPFYACYYDGKKCDKVTPRFNPKTGKPVKVSNKEIKARYGHVISAHCLEHSWDVCDKCPRNCCMSGVCSGHLKWEDEAGNIYEFVLKKS